MKETGILMPLSALPSRTGIGELGRPALEWLEMLEPAHVTIWQLLPLNPVGYGNSPYQPYSSCAGDEIYISLDDLYEKGLLKTRPEDFREMETRVDYDAVRKFKEPFLREAFWNFRKDEGYEKFISQEWVTVYGVFRALKQKNGGVCWNEWPQEERDWCENRTELSAEVWEEAGYHMFLQYVFAWQWSEVHKAARERGIRIMGDVPFYVGVDSVDVWGGKDNFLLDTDGRPIFIAGVPPDYFSATGQRWGNPIYNWDYMKQQDYRFWVDRIGYNSRMYDIIRIDHFRAFDTFWKIPSSCPTAMEGEWVEAPGYEVLDTLYRELPDVDLAAEDLGDLRPEVLTLRDHYHLKGMKIQIFGINPEGKYAVDELADRENMINYTGTHDNDTLMEWYGNLSTAAKRKVRRFLTRKGYKQGPVQDRLLAYTLGSSARFVILPLADVLGLEKEGHINTPGTVGSPNWEWKAADAEAIRQKLMQYRHLFQR